jgi:RNA polymerase sigma factor (sigma-70 family)
VDRRTLEALYTAHGPMVLRRARLLLRDDQAAHDALHDVFLRVLRTEGEFRAQASPATWLYRIATNHCLNVLRDERRRVELRTRYLRPPSEAGGDADAPIQLAQILRHVRPELQEIAIYHLVDDLKHEEIAELLGVSRRTIGNRLEEFRAEVARVFDAEPEASHVSST